MSDGLSSGAAGARADFLLELLSEEIPARMQRQARADLARLFAEALAAAAITGGEIVTYSTPRRLALIARGLPLESAALSEEIKGPRVGAPPQALDGFLRKTGLARQQLIERGGVWFALVDKPGRSIAGLLGEAVETIVRDFPWPKSMRWGAASAASGSLRWVRPLHSIVALLGEEIVPVAIEGVTGASPAKVGTGFASGGATNIKAGAATLGHRFHHPGQITIGGAHDYVEKLRACHVVVDHREREALIRDGARAAAAAAGLALVEDEGLVAENAGLTEWPMPLLGRFDAAFLDVPREVIVLTMRTNQKYFACTGAAGELAPAFVCTANIAPSDGGASIIEGNRRVLAARLSDARFFWQQDLQVPLDEQAKKLGQIVFHEKLGTVADKVERVAELARSLVKNGIVKPCAPATAGAQSGPLPSQGHIAALADAATRAARLAKADLVTGMVGEFPELQGVIGGHLARAQGEPAEIADAIRDHYKPVGQGDEVPTASVTVAVSLADKLDTLLCFFAIKEKPTGSKDPFALRRAVLGVIEIVIQNDIRIGFRKLVGEVYRIFSNDLTARHPVIFEDLDDPSRWSPLLKGDAAYRPLGEQLLVLKDEPPFIASDKDAQNRSIWNPLELRQRDLMSFEICGFLDTVNEVTEFCFDRLRDREKRAGRRHDLISAVLPRNIQNILEGLDIGDEWMKLPNTTANDDVIRILNLGQSLEVFIGSNDGANLLAGYKRAANILKKEKWDANSATEANVELAEAALAKALAAAEPKAVAAIEAEDFTGAMAALASLRGPIDAFFEAVKVNDPDPAVRARRLNLLLRFRDAVHRVADFSKIEG